MSRIICIFNDCFNRAYAEELCVEHYHEFIFSKEENLNSVAFFISHSKREQEYIRGKYGEEGCMINSCEVKTKGRLLCKKHNDSFNDQRNEYGMDLESYIIMSNNLEKENT